MEFTRIEKRILNNKHNRLNKICLWIGIICLILAIGTIFFTAEIAKKTHAPFSSAYTSIQKEISPKTDLEIRLKRSLLEATKTAGEGWYNYAYEKGLSLFSYFLFFGVFLILHYFSQNIYINLINKIKGK